MFELVEAARILATDGFEVFPYTTEDLVVAERLLDAGCRVLMPWGAPIGSLVGLRMLELLGITQTPGLGPIPALGEHTDSVLRELGLDNAAISDLRAHRAIGPVPSHSAG